MDPIRVIHIAPELPPTVGGVADYTAILSRRLVDVSDGAVEPVLVDAGNEEAGKIDVEFPVTDLSGQCSVTKLAETIGRLVAEAGGRAIVLLEYSGYGYAKRGVPLWLERGLSQVCGDGGVRLITVFHELYATGPPWTSAFWMSFVQKHIVRRLAQLGSGIITNRSSSAEFLQAASKDGTLVKMQPVFSNVGEPDRVPSLNERGSVAVVFGGTGKDALYAQHGDDLMRCLKTLGIDRVIDIGPPPSRNPVCDEAIHVDIQGFIDQEAISDYLKQTCLGVLCRNPRALTKSGSLAAYMAHGVPSVVAFRHSTKPSPILEAGLHYISFGRLVEEAVDWNESKDAWATIGREGREWYMSNAHSQHAARNVLRLIPNA